MRQALRDLAALVARVGVGGIFFANGWTKLERGLTATGVDFANQGAPVPGAWATATMLAELIGGALLIAGLAVTAVGLILFTEALAVFVVARPLNPISLNELILLGAASLLLAVVGAGRVSVDHMVVIRRRESEAASEFAADTEADRVIASLRDPDNPGSDRAKGGKTDAPDAEPAADRPRAGKPKTEPNLEDTAPHPRPSRRPDPDEPAASPAPGDTLVAGRKKPAPRGRRQSSTD
ncbi:DoxX family protein [Nonomuraea sediminis]|uniref:DoxX family protein n=1 Tax=Nonomuraea sediminis TaxID=2835864 RepID=UPI001BDBC01D|nr:DoxX family protein [Nonomuraea sediminis]